MIDHATLAAAYHSGYAAAYADVQDQVNREVQAIISNLLTAPAQPPDEQVEEVTLKRIKFKDVTYGMRVRVETGKDDERTVHEFTVCNVTHDGKYSWFDSMDSSVTIDKEYKPKIYLFEESE